jgi:hypothetical protein
VTGHNRICFHAPPLNFALIVIAASTP